MVEAALAARVRKHHGVGEHVEKHRVHPLIGAAEATVTDSRAAIDVAWLVVERLQGASQPAPDLCAIHPPLVSHVQRIVRCDTRDRVSTFDASKGATARDQAIEAIDEATSEEWKRKALEAVRIVAAQRAEFTTDPVWYVLEKQMNVPAPKDPRAMGPLMRKATTLNICATTDRTVKSVRAECHRRPITVYRSLIFKPKEPNHEGPGPSFL